MSVRLYMDVHVPRAITLGLRIRGVDVLTAQEDHARALPDSELLDRATMLGRVLFSRDTDLLADATARQRGGRSFAGVVYAHQLHVTIGQCIDDLELIATAAARSSSRRGCASWDPPSEISLGWFQGRGGPAGRAARAPGG